MALGVLPLVIDHAAPDHAQLLTSDINDALNRLATAADDANTALETSIADVAEELTATTSALSNYVTATYPTNTALSAVIPEDDTIPQNTEGTQVLSVTITPTSSTSTILLRGHGWGVMDTALVNCIYAVFSSQSADAIQAGLFAGSNSAAIFVGFDFNVRHSPATTSPVTYSVRVGVASAASLYLNGSATRKFGGASAAYLVAQEIPA